MAADLVRRYGRQSRLAEIGDAGQAKLCAGKVRLVTVGFARVIEERYLRGSGLGVVADGAAAGSVDTDLGLRHPAAREVADGALAALAAIRAVVLPFRESEP